MSTGAFNVDDVRSRARRRADMENDTFVGDNEANQYIIDAYRQLYFHLVGKYENHFAIDSSLFTIAGTADYELAVIYTGELTLPVIKLLAIGLDAGGGQIERMTRVNVNDSEYMRLRYSGNQGKPYRYEFHGTSTGDTKVRLVPVPDAVYTVRFVCVIAPPPPNTGSPAMDNFISWIPFIDEYLVLSCAIAMKDKEESDVSVLLGERETLLHRIESALEPIDESGPRQIARMRHGGLGGIAQSLYDDPFWDG